MAWWYCSDGCRGDDDDEMMGTMVEVDEDGDGIRLRVAMIQRGREKARVGASGVDGRVDRVTRKLFEAHRKTSPEKFSDGGDVVAGGSRGGRRRAAENGRGERD
ncbi:hypothetical protein Tco_1442360 [Tanacetum coccineum]